MMRSRRISLRALWFALLVLPSPWVSAHRVPECLTTVTPVDSESMVEVVHRLHRHDAATALAHLTGRGAIDLQDLKTRASFALYVEGQFDLLNSATGQTLPLTLVGAQLEGEHLLVFQEHRGQLPAQVRVRSNTLRPIYSDQVNLVHIRWPTHTQRLTFAGDTGWLTANIDAQLPKSEASVPR